MSNLNFESIPIFPFVGEFDVFHESKYVVMSTDPASKTSINITVVVVTDALLNLKIPVPGSASTVELLKLYLVPGYLRHLLILHFHLIQKNHLHQLPDDPALPLDPEPFAPVNPDEPALPLDPEDPSTR
jgi:hypothetical protein